MEFSFNSRFLNFSWGGRYNRNTDRYTLPLNVQSQDFDAYYNQLINHKVEISKNGSEAEIYKTTSDVGLVVGRKANMASNGRFKVFDYNTDEEIDIKKNTTAREIIKLLERPNPFQSGAEFIKQYHILKAIYGNVFIYQNFAIESSTIPKAIYLLPPHLMTVVPTGKMFDQLDIEGIIKHYELIVDGNKFRAFKPKDIIHIKNFNPSNVFIGLSPLEQLGLDVSNTRVGKGFLNAVSSKLGAIGAITPDGIKSNDYGAILPIEEDQRLEIEKQMSEKTHGIFDGQSKIKISSVPLKWVSFSAPIQEHQVLEQLDDNKRTVIDMYGMNENIFSKKGGSKYDNLLEGEKQAYTSTIIPEAEELTDSLVRSWKIFEENGFYLQLSYSHVEALKSDRKQQSEINEKNTKALKTLVVDLQYSKDEAIELLRKGVV